VLGEGEESERDIVWGLWFMSSAQGGAWLSSIGQPSTCGCWSIGRPWRKTVPWLTVNPVAECRSGDARPVRHDLFYESRQANSATDATPEATHQRVRYQGLTVVAAFQGRTCQLGAKEEIRYRPSDDEAAALPAPCRSQLPLEHRESPGRSE
jgi:hypothetical protein